LYKEKYDSVKREFSSDNIRSVIAHKLKLIFTIYDSGILLFLL